jgi:membrane protease YdiL (CAAX protease family)
MMAEHDGHEDRNLVLYFVIVFAWSGLSWLPIALFSLTINDPLGALFSIISVFGPLASAFILTYFNQGKDGIRRLLRRGVDRGFGKKWLIPIFLLFPALNGSAVLVATLTEKITIDMSWVSNLPSVILGDLFMFILFCVWAAGEEFGWRGYALDRLQGRFNAIISSIVLGIIWWAWHIPALGFQSSTLGTQPVNVWIFLVTVLEFAVLLTWIYNNTKGSILAVILFHAMFNMAAYATIPMANQIPTLSIPNYYSLIVLLAIVIVVTIVYGPKELVRQTKKHNGNQAVTFPQNQQKLS